MVSRKAFVIAKPAVTVEPARNQLAGYCNIFVIKLLVSLFIIFIACANSGVVSYTTFFPLTQTENVLSVDFAGLSPLTSSTIVPMPGFFANLANVTPT